MPCLGWFTQQYGRPERQMRQCAMQHRDVRERRDVQQHVLRRRCAALDGAHARVCPRERETTLQRANRVHRRVQARDVEHRREALHAPVDMSEEPRACPAQLELGGGDTVGADLVLESVHEDTVGQRGGVRLQAERDEEEVSWEMSPVRARATAMLPSAALENHSRVAECSG